MDRLAGLGKIFASVGGAAWTVKSGLIIAMNRHFQPIEGVLYFLGVGGILLGALGFGAFIARRWSGAARWIGFLAVVAVAVVVTSVTSSLIQNAVAGSYIGSNVGMEEEIGILVPGIIWLGVGIYPFLATSRRRRAG